MSEQVIGELLTAARTFCPSQGKVTGKPYVAFITVGGDGRRALDSVERIRSALKLTRVSDAAGRPSPGVLGECEQLGRKLAESV